MNGIYVDLKEDALAFVASDGHKLVRNLNFTVKSDTPASLHPSRKNRHSCSRTRWARKTAR